MLPILVSCIGLLISAISLWYARKAYALTEKREDRQGSKFQFYVIKCASVSRNDENGRVIELIVNVYNSSDMPNSVLFAEIQVDYELKNLTVVAVKYPVRMKSTFSKSKQFESTFKFPLHFLAREARRFECEAEISDAAKPNDGKILEHNLVIISGDGEKSAVSFELFYENPIF